MKVFVAGLISDGGRLGVAESMANYERIIATAGRLRAAGHDPRFHVRKTGHRRPWAVCLRDDLPLLCQCDAILLLPGWRGSRGARLEAHVAYELGIPTGFFTPDGFELNGTTDPGREEP